MKQKLLSILLLCVMLASTALAQDKRISGKVTSKEDGLPLPGVSVKVTGTKLGTQTDANGNYSIIVPTGSKNLEVSFIGFISQTIAIGEKSVVNAFLETDSKQLSEVIVTGYGTQSRTNQTGAVSQVSGVDLTNSSFTSPDKALQGKVAGLQSISRSGQPGSIAEIRIRGIGSITGSSSPLYVVDGVPINSGDLSRLSTTSNALAGINPNDIESLTVLKDASASSIYGSRAANGVVIITTKKGKAGKTEINFNTEVGNSERAYFNENTRSITTAENITLFRESILNAFALTPAQYSRANAVTDMGIKDSTINTNWYDQVSQKGTQQQYNLSVNGGNDKTRFYVSGGYLNSEGTIRTAAFKRYTSKINLSHEVSSKLSIGANLGLTQSKLVGTNNSGAFANPILSNLFLEPWFRPYDDNGNIIANTAQFGTSLYNPVAIATYNKNGNNTLLGSGQISAAYKILPNLKFTTKYGVDYNNLEEDSYNNPNYGDGASSLGRSYRYYTRYFNWVWTNLLDYHWDVLKNNDLIANVTAGYESQKSQYYSINVQSNNLPLNYDYTTPGVGATPITASGTNTGYTFDAILASADFTYKSKYVISGSYRRDGSSRFGAKNRFGNFYSVGASWNLDQESFVKKINWITQLKLRGSYGSNGNAGIGDYSALPYFGFGYNYLGSVGTAPLSIGNDALTWEKNNPLDVGLDVSLFRDRISFTGDYYSRKTTNLLLNYPISATTGFTTFLANIGAMKNEGIELSLSGTPIIYKGFKMNLNVNYSQNKNTVLALKQDKQIVSPFIRQVGQDIQSYYLRQYAGVDPANGSPLWYTDETRTTTTSTYTSAARVLVNKSASPKAFGSFGTDMSYKGISVSALFYYSYGNYIYDPYYQYLNSGGYYNGSYNQRATELNRWQKAGDITDVPRVDYNGTNSYQQSDRILVSGDYIRLRDITLGYAFPKAITSKLKVSSLRLYARGSNVATWAKDKKLPYDPEAGGINGNTNFDQEIPKSLVFGLNVGF
nr:TonB-dependent receptor [Pseudopedobacter sp.]